MGVNTDVKAPPFQPIPPKPGVLPSGIAGRQDIRSMANNARQRVSSRQQQFLNMVANSATPDASAQPAEAPAAQYAKMGRLLDENRDIVDRFVDWVLFG